MIYLIRHAAGRHNETKDYNNPSFVDAILTQKGREQAKRLRDEEDLRDPDVVICSPLSRAFETACLGFPESKIEIDELCREKRMYICDILRSEVNLNLPEETNAELMIRAKLFIEKLRGYDKDKKIVVVTHGKFINAMTNALAGRDELAIAKYFKNTDIIKLKI